MRQCAIFDTSLQDGRQQLIPLSEARIYVFDVNRTRLLLHQDAIGVSLHRIEAHREDLGRELGAADAAGTLAIAIGGMCSDLMLRDAHVFLYFLYLLR